MSFLNIEHVGKDFPNREGGRLPVCVLDDVTLNIERGEFLTVVGHSGCGKSTLLNILAGFEKTTRGRVVLDGKPVTAPGLDRMVVFQNFALLPWMSAFENVRVSVQAAFPSWDRAKIRLHAEKYFHLMGLAGAENKQPAHLSGGMRQRVGLARAFAVEPKILLLDEPFAQIDALTRGSIQEQLMKLWAETHQTIFLVTHDVDEAILLSDRIVLMTNGPKARVADYIPVGIPRPRLRTELIDMPEYMRLRSKVLHFLMEHAAVREPNGKLVSA